MTAPYPDTYQASQTDSAAFSAVCGHCGVHFQRGRSDQRFCGDSCRKKSWRAHRKQSLRDRLVAAIDEVLR